MNRDARFELQLGRWLEEGPFEAPSEPVAAALAHVRANPRPPRVYGGWWRRAMSGITLTHVPSEPRRGWLVAAAAVVGLVVVAGYGFYNLGGQGGSGGGPTPTPVVTAVPTGSGMATAQQTCTPLAGEATIRVDDVIQTRGGVMDCTHTSTDARLAGSATVTMDIDERPDGLWLAWGSIELRNDGGAWTGTYSVSSRASATSMEFEAVWLGSGGYEGLEVLNHIRVPGTGPSRITSRVFEAGPLITGTESGAEVLSVPTEHVVGDVTATRDIVIKATDTMSDPRVSGDRTVTCSVDQQPDDGGVLWGTGTLTNDMGSWEGFWFGTADPGYTTKHIHSLMRGTGAYEGLFFRLEVVGTGDPGYDLTGEIIEGF